MVEAPTLWTRFRVISNPRRGVNSKREWMVVIPGRADERLNTLGNERALGQRRVQAAMTALEGPL